MTASWAVVQLYSGGMALSTHVTLLLLAFALLPAGQFLPVLLRRAITGPCALSFPPFHFRLLRTLVTSIQACRHNFPFPFSTDCHTLCSLHLTLYKITWCLGLPGLFSGLNFNYPFIVCKASGQS